MLQTRPQAIGVCLAMAFFSTAPVHAQVSGEELLDAYAVTQDEVEQLEGGNVLAYSDKQYESTERELAADAMVLIDTDLASIRELVKGATTLIPVKYMIDHAEVHSAADFEGVEYLDDEYEEVEKLFDAKAGKRFNLSESELAELQAQLKPYSKAGRAKKIGAASAAIRQILRGRFEQYQTAGLQGIEPYKRSRRKQIDIGEELRLTTRTFTVLAEDFPGFYNAMMNFPDGADCCDHSFRWLKAEVRDRPVFVLTHTISQASDEFVLLTERHYFASNQLNSIQITLGWVPYADGTYMGVAMSASTDVLDSMMGRMLRPVGRNKAKDLVTDVLQDIRTEMSDSDIEAAEE